MEVVSLDSKLKPLFRKHVNQDIPHFYFFILDLTHDEASTKIWLALNKENRIEGMMLVYQRRIAQLRGSVKAARALLAELDVEKVEIQTLEGHRNLIFERFEVNRTFELMLMTLRKGEETLQMKYSLVKLSTNDARDIAALIRHGDPEWWGEMTGEKITEGMNERLWLGAKADGKLVSVGGAKLDDRGSCINTVVTDEKYRNRGYATSIVSALVEEILQKSTLALIHVEKDNLPAVKAYTNVGFQPYTKYFVARAEKR